jgi:hypothetical protein
MGEMRNAFKILTGKPERNRQLIRPGHKWDDIIKIDLIELCCGEWTGFIWLRIGTDGCLEHDNKPFGSIKGG